MVNCSVINYFYLIKLFYLMWTDDVSRYRYSLAQDDQQVKDGIVCLIFG